MADSNLISDVTIANAVEALKACVAKLKVQKKNLFALGDNEHIFLQFAFKKISLQRQTAKVLLPNSVVDETTMVCLFVRDIDRNDRDYSITIDKYREMIDQLAIKPHIDIVPLKQLKLEYKEYESKRRLLAAYDTFLADERITHFLPSRLGKHFFKRKRFPLQVNMACCDLQSELSKALNTSCCIMTGRGSSGQMTVGKLSQSTEQVTENILCCVGKLASSVAGGWNNMRSVHIRAQDTPSIPVYVSFGSKDEVKLEQRKRVKVEQEAEDVSTVTTGKVMVSMLGTARVLDRDQPSVKVQRAARSRGKRAGRDQGAVRQKTTARTTTMINKLSVKTSKKLKQNKKHVDKALIKRQITKQRSMSQQPSKKKRRLA